MYSDLKAILGKSSNNRGSWCAASIGRVFLVTESKDSNFASLKVEIISWHFFTRVGHCYNRSCLVFFAVLFTFFMADNKISQSSLLTIINSEDSLPESCLITHFIRLENVDQALQILFEAGATKAKRTLQVLASYALVTLYNCLDFLDIAAGCQFAKCCHRVIGTDPLGDHCVAHELA